MGKKKGLLAPLLKFICSENLEIVFFCFFFQQALSICSGLT